MLKALLDLNVSTWFFPRQAPPCGCHPPLLLRCSPKLRVGPSHPSDASSETSRSDATGSMRRRRYATAVAIAVAYRNGNTVYRTPNPIRFGKLRPASGPGQRRNRWSGFSQAVVPMTAEWPLDDDLRRPSRTIKSRSDWGRQRTQTWTRTRSTRPMDRCRVG